MESPSARARARRATRQGAPEEEERPPLPVALPRSWVRPVVRDVRPRVDEGRRPAKTTVGEQFARRGRCLRRRARSALVRAAVPPRVGDGLGHEPDDQVLRRSLVRLHPHHPDRWLPLRGAGPGRCLRRLAGRPDGTGGGGSGPRPVSRVGRGSAGSRRRARRQRRARPVEGAGGVSAYRPPRSRERGASGGGRMAAHGQRARPTGAGTGPPLRTARLHAGPARRPSHRLHLGELSRPGRADPGALQRLVRDVPPLRLHRRLPRDPRGRPATARLRRRGWASTSCTCPRSTRSARRPARAGTIPARPAPTTRAARGPSARSDGGHTAIHPDLGTLEDFRALLADASRERASRSPSTSRSRPRPTTRGSASIPSGSGTGPDGTIRYAENPPKKYEDIYPFDFESEDWPSLWTALLDVVLFWIEPGRAASSGSTTRTPSPSPSGNGCSPASRPRPRRHLPVGGVHAPPGHGGAGPKRVHASPTPTSRGAPRSGSSRPTSAELTAHGHRRLLPAQPVAQHAGHPLRGAPAGRPHRLPGPPGAGRHACRRATASTDPRSSCRSTCRESRDPRSTCARRSTRFGPGTSRARRACRGSWVS